MDQQKVEQSEQADSRLLVFRTRRGWQAGTLLPALLLFYCIMWIFSSWLEIVRDGDIAAHVDFRVFWAAAKLAFAGVPLEAFDMENLESIHGVIKEDLMPWLYPPSFMAALYPLGALSFTTAWSIFTVISLGAALIAFRPFCARVTPVWIGVALAPAILPNMMMGQTSVLWTAGFVGAMALLRAERPILAGVLIGLLTMKPQLGLLIPIALIASKSWPTFISASVTTIVLSIVSTALFGGLEYWHQLSEITHTQFEHMSGVSEENVLMISAFSTFSSFGLSESTALILQWMTTAIAAVFVFVAWSSPKIDFDLRVATLLMGIIASTPYLWYYEATLLSAAALFFVRAGILSGVPGMILGTLMWLGITPIFLVRIFSTFHDASLRVLFAPIATVAVIVCFTAVFRRIRPSLSAQYTSQGQT